MHPTKILIVDDDDNILFAFQEVLGKEGYAGITARDGNEAIAKVAAEQPGMIFMDITMPHLDGLAALQRIKEHNHSTPVVMITGYGTMQTAIKAVQLGAFEYLTKPVSVAKIREVVQRARLNLQAANLTASQPAHFNAEVTNRHELIGESAAMQEVYKLIGAISTTPNHTSVLIAGESGTGKELVARAIHSNSAFPREPFVAINCTAFPETLLESELFGHEKGTFTGATERKLGKFEISHQGTIFLDEIGDLSPHLQQKLLRVLQEREFERLGGNNAVQIEARFIAATNQDLPAKVKAGTFRDDLFYRLNVVAIQMPPLREHREDIPLLANYFLKRYNDQLRKTLRGFSEEAMTLLQAYGYPGNVRELENLVERAVMLTKGDIILSEVFGEILAVPPKPRPLPISSPVFSKARNHVLDLFEKQFVQEQLARYHGNVSAAAKASGMSRQNFHRLLAKHKIQTDDPGDDLVSI